MLEPDWPCEGLPLAAAIEHLLHPAALDRDASNLLATVVDVRSVLAGEGSRAELIATGQGARAAVAVERFKALMTEGRYRARGRRGSPTAEPTDIPSSAWPDLGLDIVASQVIERTRGGVILFDVRILPPAASAPPAVTPVRSPPSTAAAGRFRSAKECRDWYFAEHPLEPNQKVSKYALEVIEFCRLHGFEGEEPSSTETRYYEFLKHHREQLAQTPTKSHKRPTRG
jgi:hypothetical protein